MNQPVIYIAYCTISGKVYVGQTVRFQRRKHDHLKNSASGTKGHPKFYSALRLHGSESFRWSTITCPSMEKLTSWEGFWSELLGSVEDGYNCCKPGMEYSQAFRAKLSKVHSGRVFTPEWKQKISDAKKGVKFSDAHRLSLSTSHLGKKPSPESVAKRSASLTGRKLSPEHVARISAANTGKKYRRGV